MGRKIDKPKSVGCRKMRLKERDECNVKTIQTRREYEIINVMLLNKALSFAGFENRNLRCIKKVRQLK